jgi:hypothetical protein
MDCTYQVDRTGEYSFPDESWNRDKQSTSRSNADDDVHTLTKGQYFVAGNNGRRSMDSRVWGPLRGEYIFGTADWVIYPMNHFGPIAPGPFSVERGLAGATIPPEHGGGMDVAR